MNSADQGVQPMDTAFKRRWVFEHISIDASEESVPADFRPEHTIDFVDPRDGITKVSMNWWSLRTEINRIMIEQVEGISEDRLLGPYFLSKEELQTPEGLQNAIANKVLHYLRDDILRYNDATILFYQELPLSVLKRNLSQGKPVLSVSFFEIADADKP